MHTSSSSVAVAAAKIQKVFRGYLVRKSLKEIMLIRREIDEFEKFISEEENIDLIRKDDIENLKVNETLICLLLRLHLVCDADSGVKDFMKAVIVKAIDLHKTLDSLVSESSAPSWAETTRCDGDDLDVEDGEDSIPVEVEDEGILAEDVPSTKPTSAVKEEEEAEDWEEISLDGSLRKRRNDEDVEEEGDKNEYVDEPLKRLIAELAEKNENRPEELLQILSDKLKGFNRAFTF